VLAQHDGVQAGDRVAPCLLIVLAQARADFPLVVAANRDELYERPAVPMAVLRAAGPRVVGGRDLLAGGTWLAVNEHGVFAGLTNRPVPTGRDPSRRSRGELPLALASHRSAAAAVESLGSTYTSSDYNPAWILVGDRESLFAIEVGDRPSFRVEALPAGVHVLENRPLGAVSPKVRHVLELLAGIDGLPAGVLEQRLRAVLRDHKVPAEDDPRSGGTGAGRLPAADAACVHTDRYGTRWSCVVRVPALAAGRPTVLYTDGAPCRADYRDATPLWSRP
jgi:uncharacterized protein with NRDE domain